MFYLADSGITSHLGTGSERNTIHRLKLVHLDDTRRGTDDCLHLCHEKLFQGLGVEQGLGLLEQAGLVGTTTPLGNEKEVVAAARDRVELHISGTCEHGCEHRVQQRCKYHRPKLVICLQVSRAI